MSSVINTNLNALNAQRNLTLTGMAFAKSVEKLSSGLRINRASDDAAGLSISERMRSQISGLNQANRNAQDGISMIQTAEGGLNEIHAMLQRMYELATQASNDTLSTTDRTAIKAEVTALQNEINAQAAQTKFNGKTLLNGNLETKVDTALSQVQNGFVINAGSNTAVSNLDVSGGKAGETYNITAVGAAITIQRASDSVAQTVTSAGAAAGGNETLDFSALGIKITYSSVAAVTGANVGTGLAGKNIKTLVASGAATLQTGAYAGETLSVSFSAVDTASLGINTAITNYGSSLNTATAQALMSAVSTAIDSVSSARSTLGAVQNRLEHTVNNLGVAAQNVTASQSRIRDLDVAAEMVNFTKLQILNQAGTAILAQANSSPQAVLALLR